jgi:hypothetical protein
MCENSPGWIWLRTVENKIPVTKVVQLDCGQWSCTECAARMKKSWWHNLMLRCQNLTLDKGVRWSFITLTAHESAHDNQTTLANIRVGFKRLYDRIRRLMKDTVHYCRLFEFHDTRAYHLHMICSVSITHVYVKRCKKRIKYFAHYPFADDPKNYASHGLGRWAFKTWLKTNARQCAMGYEADYGVLGLNVATAVSYVTKYMTKEYQSFGEMSKGLRRVQASSALALRKKKSSKAGWQFQREITPGWLFMMRPVKLLAPK